MSPDIFQEKMSDLMAGLEFVRTYLDDLLIISNSTFEDHLHQLQVVLRRLRRAGLKVNAEKSSFFAPEIEYLGYMLTKDGIKPVQKKVQAVLDLQPLNYPETTKEIPGYGPILQRYVETEKPHLGSPNRPCRRVPHFRYGCLMII